MIQRAPSSLEIDVQPHEALYPDVDLHIRATNLDSHSTGWAALIPGLIEKRVKMVLDDGVDPREVAGKFTVRANVIVHSKPQGKGQNLTPYKITVVKIVTP
ncbi:hypothetical protein [Laribacter hongkongensis]|uniref:hypothetical protein n=1 Tax=Laribacter hongkongensis TaxID=168471 RepID=UPI001EFE7990|nr:hypothetical protein [Laribacter hongkongensis]MCG9093983.1 hypothetical protein [Laribacter hongkongensis]